MQSKKLTDFYDKLKKQGKTITLDKDSIGDSAITDQWKSLLNSESFILSSATLSKPDETGNFTASGKSSFMKFGELSLSFDLFVSYDSSTNTETEELQCVIRPASKIELWNLKNDFPGMPGYVDYSVEKISTGLQTSFLTLIDFKGLMLGYSSFDFQPKGSAGKTTSYTGDTKIEGEIMKSGINFGASIGTDNDFFRTVKQITKELGTIDIFVNLSDEKGNLQFEAGSVLDLKFTISSTLSVSLKKLVITSGLSKGSLQSPGFSIFSEIDVIDPALELEIDIAIGRSWINFKGFFEKGRVLTLDDIAKKLGMEGLNIAELFPQGTTEKYFGEIGLKDFNLQMSIVPPNVSDLSFTISTGNPWVIINNIVTLQPFLKVEVENPFIKAQRKAELEILGKWVLGKTDFYVYALPLSGDVSAMMDENETLDVTALTEKLLPGIKLPEIDLEKMVFTANYLNKTYMVQLAAATQFEFDIGTCKLGISEVGFSCYFDGTTMQNLEIYGSLFLGGLMLDIDGKCEETESATIWTIHGGIRSVEEINFKQIFNDLVSDLNMSGAKIPDTIPDKYLSVEIGGLCIDYESKDKTLTAYVDLISPFQISDKFEIDEIAIHLRFSPKGLQSASVKVLLTIVSIDIVLELDKKDSVWSFEGGTAKGQKIPVGHLVEDLLKKFDCTIEIPKMIEEFVIDNINITYKSSSKNKEFSFTCEGSLPIEGKELDLTASLNFSKSDNKYSFEIEGIIKIETLTFDIDFVHHDKENILVAIASEDPPLNISLHNIISKLSDEAGQIIPTSLSINLQDAFFILANESKGKGKSETDDTGGLKILFGIDIGTGVDLHQVDVIGQLFPKGTNVGIDDLQGLVATKPVKGDLIKDIDDILDKHKRKTKIQADKIEYPGLYISALFNLVEVKPKLTLPIVKKPSKAKPNAIMSTAMITTSNDSDDQQKIHWNNINKTVGPIQLRRIGVGLQKSNLTFAIDISLVTSGLEIDLIDLWLSIDVGKPFKKIPGFGLHGIDVAYSQPPIEFNGGLLYVNPVGEGYSWEINGQLVIKYADYGFFGVASYAMPKIDNWPFKDIQPIPLPSFFAFLMVSAPIGGPPYIYLSGLAGGAGFNRFLKVPYASELLSFPLVQGALDSGDLKAGMKADAALTAMNKWVPPKPDDFWLAIGVSFGSCHIINAFVMVAGVFGTDFELAIIGLASADIPTEESAELIAHIELALVGTFNPMHGSIEITGALTSTSYLFVPQCKITGGFAYCMWLEKEDFLISIGGYSPAFKRPDYYPILEHLGINWTISSHLILKGGVYCAYTSSCVMAGGELNLDFHLGPVKAWLTAHADFLMQWLPLHYDISIGVSIGVSVAIHILFIHKTIKLEISADLHLWGPSFAGKAKVHLWIVSFTISFGANSNKKPPKLQWDKFFDSLLAGNKKKPANANALLTAEADKPSINTISVKEGLTNGIRQTGKEDYWIISADKFVFETKSTVPSNKMTYNDTDVPLESYNTKFGIRPMGKTTMESNHQVTFEQVDNGKINDVLIKIDVASGNLPEATWSNTELKGPSAGTVDNVPVGITICSLPQNYYTVPQTGEVDTKIFMFEALPLTFSWGSTQALTNKIPQDKPREKLKETIMSVDIKTKRSQILNELCGYDFNLLKEADLFKLADSPENIFQSAPQLFTLGAIEE